MGSKNIFLPSAASGSLPSGAAMVAAAVDAASVADAADAADAPDVADAADAATATHAIRAARQGGAMCMPRIYFRYVKAM